MKTFNAGRSDFTNAFQPAQHGFFCLENLGSLTKMFHQNSCLHGADIWNKRKGNLVKEIVAHGELSVVSGE